MNIKKKLNELKEKVDKIKTEPNLRHEATPEQIKLYNENCDDMMLAQFVVAVDKLTIQEMKEILGLDNIKPIQLTPSDTKRVEEDAQYFREWIEEELRDMIKGCYLDENEGGIS